MTLADVMSIGVHSVTPKTPLKDAAARMVALDSGMVLVSSGTELVGTLTHRDLVHVVARGIDARDCTAEQAMTPGAVTCVLGTSVDAAAKLFREHGLRHLIIEDRGRPVGVVTLADVARASGHPELVRQTLESG